jgi:hypothetical protein
MWAMLIFFVMIADGSCCGIYGKESFMTQPHPEPPTAPELEVSWVNDRQEALDVRVALPAARGTLQPCDLRGELLRLGQSLELSRVGVVDWDSARYTTDTPVGEAAVWWTIAFRVNLDTPASQANRRDRADDPMAVIWERTALHFGIRRL